MKSTLRNLSASLGTMSSITVDREQSLGPTGTQRLSAGGWLVGPWFDLFFFANALWPLVLVVQLAGGFETRAGIEFWQVYFVTTPHRWITLPLVFLDRRRFLEQRAAFVGIFAVTCAACLAVRGWTGRLTCLLAVDYIWNAWHFASQHHGIYRIYGRLCEPQRTAGIVFEKVLMRLFLLYVILRVAGGTWSYAALELWLERLDGVVLILPAVLLFREAATFRAAHAGRLAYLVSVCGLYLALLWAAHSHRPGMVLMLSTASALFHAVEYLAIVGWQVQRRGAGDVAPDRAGEVDQQPAPSLFTRLASQWSMTLALFMVILGLGAWLADRHLMEFWLTLNVMAAFLHYAYDGMIWKKPKRHQVSGTTCQSVLHRSV